MVTVLRSPSVPNSSPASGGTAGGTAGAAGIAVRVVGVTHSPDRDGLPAADHGVGRRDQASATWPAASAKVV